MLTVVSVQVHTVCVTAHLKHLRRSLRLTKFTTRRWHSVDAEPKPARCWMLRLMLKCDESPILKLHSHDLPTSRAVCSERLHFISVVQCGALISLHEEDNMSLSFDATSAQSDQLEVPGEHLENKKRKWKYRSLFSSSRGSFYHNEFIPVR